MSDDGGEAGPDREETAAYVVFQLGGEDYALEVARVREVLDATALTRVPGGARSLVGLYNLRGHVVPVWDLRVPFGLDGGPGEGEVPGQDQGERATRAPSVLMVEPDPTRPSRTAGLLVDRVSDVLDLPPEDLQPAPSLGLGGGSAFVRGLIRHRKRFLLVLDLDRVFSTLNEEPNREPA